MKNLALFLLLLLFSCSQESLPEVDEYEACKPKIGSAHISRADPETGLIEGDIIPDKVVKNHNKGSVHPDKIWDKGIIPYFIAPTITFFDGSVRKGFDSPEDVKKIQEILTKYGEQTGLLFPYYETIDDLRKDFGSGVSIVPSLKNSSHLGMQGGNQTLTLINVTERALTHEIGHTVGFEHEQNRHDRDKHITIHWENIRERYLDQFDINPDAVDCGEFDVESVMIYSSYHATIDTTKPSMTTIEGDIIETNSQLSAGDIATIRALYEAEFAKR